MTETEAIKLVEDYLSSHSFNPARIDPSNLAPGKKAPDFDVKESGLTVFYCEVKTPALKQNEQTQMFQWMTTHSKLRDLVHKAIKQFKDQDPEHKTPWVIAITSDHFQLNWSNFVHCIQGAVAYNNQIVKDLGNTRFIQDTNKDILSTDMFIWFQVNAETSRSYQIRFFVNKDSTFVEEMSRVSNLLKPTPSDNMTD